jgi:NAD-dependent deacetylase
VPDVLTDRLSLRAYATDDWQAHVALLGDPDVAPWMDDGPDQAEAVRWTVIEKDVVVGHAEIRAQPDVGGYEVRYALSPAVWGRGLGRELVRAVTAQAFDTFALPVLHARVHDGNSRALAVLDRAGYRKIGDLDGAADGPALEWWTCNDSMLRRSDASAHSRIVILTGAGVSAESGLAVFRGAGGLWEGHRVEDVCTDDAWRRDRNLVRRFYDVRRAQLDTVTPNAAHDALARLEREWPGDLVLITQNVDDLHERAGSRNVLHMHGQLRRARCVGCGYRVAWSGDLTAQSMCTSCEAVDTLRPDIVFFGEDVMEMAAIHAALSRADMFVSIGTSGMVYPAAAFVAGARGSGAETLELNLDASEISDEFDNSIRGPATVLVPAWVTSLLG